jgi:hypothetical protein
MVGIRGILAIAALAACAWTLLAGDVAAVGRGRMCGGIAGIQCDAGLWCDPSPGKCGGADISGRCVAVPQICAHIWQPVCGCDKKIYPNDCQRQQAKAAKGTPANCY